MEINLASIRQEYTKGGLRESELPDNPFLLFSQWLQEAIDSKVDEPTAMLVGTVSPEGKPSTRTVLLKDLHDDKFIFYSNYESRKGRQLAQNPAIKIGDNLYQINTTLEANERLEIDTMKKKAVKITAHGDEINVFNDRNKDNRLYIPIPPGTNIVVWNNSFSFDIVVYDARSEPKWESDE